MEGPLVNVGTLASTSFFSQVHPAVVAVYFIELFALLLVFNHLILAIALFSGLLAISCWYFSRQRIVSVLKGIGSLMAVIVLFNLLLNQNGRGVLWRLTLGPVTFRLTRTGLLYGCTMAILLGAMILAFILFNGILTTPKLSYLLFPIVPRLAMLLTISLRLVSLFTQKFRRLVMLQKTRGIVVTEGSWRQRIQKTGRLMRILLIDSVSSAMETAVLMEARGFGAHKRSHYQTYSWQPLDVIFGTCGLLLFGLIISFRWRGFGWTTNVYQMTAGSSADWWLVLPLLVFVGLPVLGEGMYRLWEN
ncbi:cobalt ABC transporter permease [Levilactobacillus koreensis]|uniref:Cobalt ABC transporter permease n=1 Tax=Levilactobacillus koreensis TaxID=637971 RepID=A0AAC8UXA6_9LACO|nr:cobalt ABC transporter permease [Levilactobacillus koreensis]